MKTGPEMFRSMDLSVSTLVRRTFSAPVMSWRPSLKVVMDSLLTRTCRSTSKAQDPWMVKSSAGRPSRIGLSATATLGTSNAAATARQMTKMRRFMPYPPTTGTNDPRRGFAD
jgi:hypothetical protein